MGITVEQLRALALSCPGAVEGAHHGHADFRAGGRVFATLHPDGVTAMVRVSPREQAALLAQSAGSRPASGAWGRAGCTLLRLAEVDAGVARDAVTAAWQAAVEAGARRAAKK